MFYLFLLIIVGIRLYIYFTYNLKIIDTDQAYMWLGATDFSQGHFYEPRYYGQDYNTFMEALLASTLLHFNFKVYQILPLVTSFLSLFPYLFMAVYLFLKNRKIYALMVLSILICLPAQYDFMNTLPRGFVCGLFFTSFFILSIIDPRNLFLLFLNTVLAILAYYVNQNSILVSVPFLFYIFLIHFKHKTYYYVSGTALLTAYPVDLFFNAFYRAHPDYICQSTFNVFAPKYFIQSISHLDERFQHISFFIPNQSYTLLLGFLILGFMLYQHNKKAFWSFILFVFILLCSFFASKISDGSTWVFMSYSRMFLGIPILICLLLVSMQFQSKKLNWFLVCIPLVFSVYKSTNLKSELDKEDIRDIARGVRVLSIESTKQMTQFYKDECHKNACNFLLVSSTFWLNTIISSAGPALYTDYPETEETRFEKRYWVRNKNKNRLIPQFVFLSSDYDLDKLITANTGFELKRLDDYGLFLVTHNQLKMGQFIETINAIEPGLND